MENNTVKKFNMTLFVIISIIVVILLLVAIYFVYTDGGIFSKNIKKETITAENYQEIMDKMEVELKEDEELYYASYAIMCNVFQTGLSSTDDNLDDESTLYANIYGKTIQDLIDEGKKLMKDNNMTIEKFKQQIEELNNSVNELNNAINEFNENEEVN